MRRKFVAFFTSIMFILASVPFVKTTGVRAASSTPLNEATALTGGNLSASLTVGGVEIDNNSTIHYGDTIVCTLRWALPNNDIFELYPGDSLTYELPDNMDFVGKSGNILDGDNILGTYSISGHTITITYTDSKFCGNQDRIGNLSFYGSIESDPNPAEAPDPIKITFKGARDFNLLVDDNPIDAKLTVNKVFRVVDNVNHIYSCVIPITATGDQTNIEVMDTMWPGMSLKSTPKVYTTNPPTDETLFTDCSAFEDDGGDGHTFVGTIYHLENDQTVYLYYLVEVMDEMFDEDAATQFIKDNGYNTPGNYYEDGYNGTIPNRVTVKSTQVPTPVQRTTDIYGSGYNMEKWRAEFEIDKATGINELDLGYIRWQLYINPITDQKVTSGYIIDTLPENTTVDENSFFLHDAGWHEMPFSEYVSYEIYTKDGKKMIRFDFTSKMIADLKVSTESFYIEYRTHMDKQTDDMFEYVNRATLFYNDKELDNRVGRWENKKPSELAKYVKYDQTIAPYAEYTILVNPMAMDLDPNSDDLILSDTLGSALDVDLDSILVNDQAAAPGSVNFSSEDRTFTIKLKDSTRYSITYRARVNLVKDSPLNEGNANNVCELVGVITNGDENSACLKGKVYESSAGSSSRIGYATLNVVKHDKDSTGTLLSGAIFSVSSATLNGQTVTGTTSIGSGTTGSNGKTTFNDLERGTCYLFIETQAPEGYELDGTPFFVIFAADATTAYPSTVTYNGKDYEVMVVDFTKYTADKYVANALETTTDPSDPSESSDPSSSETSSTETQAPSESATEPADPSETTGDVNNAIRDRASEEPATTTTASPTKELLVKTGETIGKLAIIGGGMILVAFLAILGLAKKDKESE